MRPPASTYSLSPYIAGNLFRRRRPVRTRNEQRLHVCAAGHSGIRRLDVLAQFSLPDERASNNKGVLQAFSLPERDVEKAELGHCSTQYACLKRATFGLTHRMQLPALSVGGLISEGIFA